MISDLAAALEAHNAAPFPRGVSRGETYGSVCSVTIGADIAGWAKRVAEGEWLPAKTQARFRRATEELRTSLPEFPAEGRPYYERLLGIAVLALKRLEP